MALKEDTGVAAGFGIDRRHGQTGRVSSLDTSPRSALPPAVRKVAAAALACGLVLGVGGLSLAEPRPGGLSLAEPLPGTGASQYPRSWYLPPLHGVSVPADAPLSFAPRPALLPIQPSLSIPQVVWTPDGSLPAAAAGILAGDLSGVLPYAYAGLGSPYVWGGTSRTQGWDCSGFVQWAYRQAGIHLPRTEQWIGMTRTMTPSPGDLVAQRPDGKNHWAHVGIYVGNGMMISAASPLQGTILHSVGPAGASTFFTTNDAGGDSRGGRLNASAGWDAPRVPSASSPGTATADVHRSTRQRQAAPKPESQLQHASSALQPTKPGAHKAPGESTRSTAPSTRKPAAPGAPAGSSKPDADKPAVSTPGGEKPIVETPNPVEPGPQGPATETPQEPTPQEPTPQEPTPEPQEEDEAPNLPSSPPAPNDLTQDNPTVDPPAGPPVTNPSTPEGPDSDSTEKDVPDGTGTEAPATNDPASEDPASGDPAPDELSEPADQGPNPSETQAPAPDAQRPAAPAEHQNVMAAAALAALGGGQDTNTLLAEVLSAAGIDFDGTADELAALGEPVEVANLQPGDLLYYRAPGAMQGLVGVYVGDGMVVHGSWNGGVVSQVEADFASAPTILRVPSPEVPAS